MIIEEIAHLPGYQLLDSGAGERLEKFGEFVLARPDPGVLWKKSLPQTEWDLADAVFKKNGEDKGVWQLNSAVPENWTMRYSPKANPEAKAAINDIEIQFHAKLTPFKHTGVFPEQAGNWNFIAQQIEQSPLDQTNVLNLFGYTGIASVLCAKFGCDVTHVDASKPAISWAKENMLASGLPENSIRWVLDDALKFVKREARRGHKYNAIILDPPAFGRGAKGEVWKFNEHLPELLEALRDICEVGDAFRFLIINAYAVSIPSMALKNMLYDFAVFLELESERTVDHGELVLQENSGRLLSTGIFARLY